MNKAIFTICAKNYLGLAITLGDSIANHNENIDYFIFVADEFDDKDLKVLPTNVLIAKNTINISKDDWNQFSFKYDITEFCTSIKPLCFKYLFDKFKYDAIIYFDPDILVFNSLDLIFNHLNSKSIIVTPHITTIEKHYTGNLNERNLLYSGMFNLGFLAVKNDTYSNQMLDWWEIRLRDRCFQNVMENYFTDQKWIDFLPSFFPEQLYISMDLGFNVAPWNFYEREIINIDGKLNVKNRIKVNVMDLTPLTFVHFSGYNYNALINGDVIQNNIKNFENFPDYKIIFEIYGEYLKKSDFVKYINLNYSYNSFSNGTEISKIHRGLYRRLLEDNKIHSNPFDTNNNFYISLKKNKLINYNLKNVDKTTMDTIPNVEKKTIIINKLFSIMFRLIGSKKFFMLVRLMRSYSKTENHVYLVDKSYFKKFKIRI